MRIHNQKSRITYWNKSKGKDKFKGLMPLLGLLLINRKTIEEYNNIIEASSESVKDKN